MMSLSRRTLLVGGAAGAVVAGTGIAAIGVAEAHPAEHLVRAVIRDRFPDIRMTEDDLGRFAADFLVHGVSPAERWMLRLAGSVPGFVSNEGLQARLPGRSGRLLAVEDNIMNMFLLSTDFSCAGRKTDQWSLTGLMPTLWSIPAPTRWPVSILKWRPGFITELNSRTSTPEPAAFLAVMVAAFHWPMPRPGRCAECGGKSDGAEG